MLTFVGRGKAPARVELTTATTFFGRSSKERIDGVEQAIVIESLQFPGLVSRAHASIVKLGNNGGFEIQDLKSTNGILVDKRAVQKTALRWLRNHLRRSEAD